METLQIVAKLDDVLRYADFPDPMIDIVKATDSNANNRFKPEYLEKKSGLLVHNGSHSGRVIFAAFPSEDVFDFISGEDIRDSVLFVKHPLEWEEMGKGFIPLSEEQVKLLENRDISLYSAHSPVDNSPSFSPSHCFAEQWGLEIIEELAEGGRNYGYIVKAPEGTTYEKAKGILLKITGLNRLQEHRCRERVERIAVTAGGGDYLPALEQSIQKGCDTYATGILFFRGSDYAKTHNPRFVARLKEAGLNGLGASHYLTEVDGVRNLAIFLESTLGVPVSFVYEKKKASQLREQSGMVV